jgi:hypothetical protein
MKVFSRLVGVVSGAWVIGLVAAPAACTSSTRVISDGSGTSQDAGGGSDGASTSETPSKERTGDLCADSCAAAASADCENQGSCVDDCEKQMGQIPAGCQEQLEAAVECAIEEGTFECNASGKAIAKGCDAEGNELFACLQSGGNTGPSKCDELETGVPTCDACMDAKCCAQETACVDEPQCTDYFDCRQNGGSPDACQSSFPAGAAAAAAITQCMSQQCASQCAD